MSPGDLSKWTVDPYGATVADGKIFGRGTTDMKGNLAAMIVAASYIKADFSNELCGELVVAGSVHEECFEGVASQEIALSLIHIYACYLSTWSEYRDGHRAQGYRKPPWTFRCYRLGQSSGFSALY